MKTIMAPPISSIVFARCGLGLATVLSLSVAGLSMAADRAPMDPPTVDLGGNANPDASIADEFLAKAREAVRRRSGRSAATVDAAVSCRSPLTGTPVMAFKFTDVDGFLHQVVLDEFGRELAPDFLQREAEEARRIRGPVHPALAAAMRGGPVGQIHPVIIWLRMPEVELPQRPAFGAGLADGAADDARLEASRVWKRHAEEESAKFLAVMARLGLAGEPAESAPAVMAALDADGIAAIAGLEEVLDISLDSLAVPEGNIQRQVIGAHVVNNAGVNGSGQKVGVIEAGGRVAANNPFLTGYFQSLTNTCLDNHAALVASVIDSTNSTYPGIATGSQLWIGGSCSGSLSQLESAMNSAVNWGARVLNLSWGAIDSNSVPDARCRFVDGLTRNQGITVVKSAGNNGQQSNPNLSNPGNAYNIITVGNFNDGNTVSTSNDAMAPSSSYGDPPSTNSDRELPSIAAPGTNIRGLTNTSPWVNAHPGGSGTSFAAPAAAGASALLMQRMPALREWPETLKAILMATAIQNLEGSSRLSERDGAGGLRVDIADEVVRGIRGGTGGVAYTCSASATSNVGTMPLTAGKRTRVAICWNTDPNYSQYATQPGADLDLQIIAPNGSVVASSASWDNTFEIVDFTPSSSGTYTIRVIKFRCNASPAYLGWSWWRAP